MLLNLPLYPPHNHYEGEGVYSLHRVANAPFCGGIHHSGHPLPHRGGELGRGHPFGFASKQLAVRFARSEGIQAVPPPAPEEGGWGEVPAGAVRRKRA